MAESRLDYRLQQTNFRRSAWGVKKKRKEKLRFEVKKVSKQSWPFFSKYHYLSEKLPGGICYYYGLFDGENQIGFQCFANYKPKAKRKQWIFHSNRLVIHPDYVGLGIGIHFVNEASRLLKKEKPDIRIMAKFSSLPMFRHRQKSDLWKLLKINRKMNKYVVGGNMLRKSGFREKGVTTFSYEYVGQ